MPRVIYGKYRQKSNKILFKFEKYIEKKLEKCYKIINKALMYIIIYGKMYSFAGGDFIYGW